MQCKGCGAELTSDIRFCPYCGKEQPREQSAASSQEPQIHIHTHYNEGQMQPQIQVQVQGAQDQPAPQVQVQYPPVGYGMYAPPVSAAQVMNTPSDKSRKVALILEILLGFLGIHRFYMGHTGLGVLYLFTGGLCGIGWIVDLLVLTLGSPRDAFGRPIKW